MARVDGGLVVGGELTAAEFLPEAQLAGAALVLPEGDASEEGREVLLAWMDAAERLAPTDRATR